MGVETTYTGDSVRMYDATDLPYPNEATGAGVATWARWQFGPKAVLGPIRPTDLAYAYEIDVDGFTWTAYVFDEGNVCFDDGIWI